MFRCCECGNEYNQKPDFCDCGNDSFLEIKEEINTSKVKPKISFAPKDVASWLIFGFLIILSVIVLLFFPKISEQNNAGHTNQRAEMMTKHDIPSLDSFWVDSVPQQEQEQPDGQDKNIVNFIKNEILKKEPQKPEPVKKVSKQAPVQKKQQPATSKPVVKQQTNQVKTQTTVPKTVKAQTQPMAYEVVNYRTALRQRLLSNLDIYTIEGRGTCGVEFAVDETGKLVNRGFSFQSDNKTVNDAVYKMLMRTPKFNPPPDALINKKIKLIFDLDNESYSIRYAD